MPDDVQLPNENVFILSSVCKESELMVLNNLQTPDNHFVSNKTYKSIVGYLCMSPSMVNRLSEFSVTRNASLPSDHSPISVILSLPNVDLENLCTHAHHFRNYTVPKMILVVECWPSL